NLIYEVRNPSSSVMRGGYGMSETELLVQVVTGYLNAMQTNIDGFNKNSIPRGILTLIGEYADDELKSFKRYWNQMLRGADNRWGLPVMVSKDKNGVAHWQNLGIEYDEMMFSKWMTFLTSIGCAIYGMDPSEINFESFSAGRSSLSGSDTEEKLANSKDKGMRPLLSHYESVWSDFVVAEEDDRFGFRWVGLDPEDPQQLLDKQKQTMTVDEMRAAMGQQKHPVPLVGNAPLNPAHIPLYQQAMQPQQPDAPPPEPEDYGEEDLDEGGGDGGGPPGPDGGQPAAEDFGGNGGGAPADPGGYGEGGAEGSSFGKAMLSILEVEE
ncbi:MAG: phage portal protein, partial [Roseomonas mucosa]|nr:phage portal protein [Roseomonas mucosa]